MAVLRLPYQPSQADLLDACRTLAIAVTGADITGKLWVVQRGRIREYQRAEPEAKDV
jgi:hypothetical protein